MPQRFQAVFEEASRTTGTSFEFLLHTAQRESGMQPTAKAPTSSATGLFQFVEQTWLATMKNSGSELGYGDLADKITKVGSRYYVKDAEAREQILDLRNDPKASTLLAGALAQKNEDILAQKLNRDPSSGELYAAHFLGASGSSKLIELANSNPDLAAAKVFPQQARANRGIFYERNGEAKTVSEVYNDLVSTVPQKETKKSRSLADILGLGDLFKSRQSEKASRYVQVNEEPAETTQQASAVQLAAKVAEATQTASEKAEPDLSETTLESFFARPGKPLLPSRYGLSYNSTDAGVEARSSRLVLGSDGQRIIEAARDEMRKSRVFTAEDTKYVSIDPPAAAEAMKAEALSLEITPSDASMPLPRGKSEASVERAPSVEAIGAGGAIPRTNPVTADTIIPAPIDLVGDEETASVSTHEVKRSRTALDLTAFLSREVFKLVRNS
ncbi:transglycosylase SLT domain-containing protein [uncultured Cohaesibacter sp.]|uniref:transglycosylase SLT domain-containing protein n=1 Tax=uncultured Cohaesibacter sp. TaxID=1002546 RepID=UPI0029C8BBD8|nr:transglycosylase SLT domain-containing protein [uncultured Cohaesibacter sp.]